MKKRILFLLQSDIPFNNFVTSGALEGINQEHELELLVPTGMKFDTYLKAHYFRNSPNLFSERVRYHLDFLSMSRYKDRSSTFSIKFNNSYTKNRSFAFRLLASILSLPLLFELIVSFYESITKNNKDLETLLKDINPDLIMFPSYFNDRESIQLMRAAKKLNLRTFMIMGNWDNVASKGVLRKLPDFLGVWGSQTFDQAIKIHHFDRNQIFILGSPQFDKYFNFKMETIDMFAEKNGFNKDLRYFLFLGMARWRDEIYILELLDKFIKDNSLFNLRIIYRPHPWRDKELNKRSRNFLDMDFNHILIDPKLKNHYKNMMEDPDAFQSTSFIPDHNYSMELISFSSGVIASLTTMGIESMILGKNVLLPVFKDREWDFSLDEIKNYEHHRCWNEFSDTVFCDDIQKFEDCFIKFVNLSDNPDVKRIKDDVYKVVYNNHQKYSENLLEAVNLAFKAK